MYCDINWDTLTASNSSTFQTQSNGCWSDCLGLCSVRKAGEHTEACNIPPSLTILNCWKQCSSRASVSVLSGRLLCHTQKKVILILEAGWQKKNIRYFRTENPNGSSYMDKPLQPKMILLWIGHSGLIYPNLSFASVSFKECSTCWEWRYIDLIFYTNNSWYLTDSLGKS